MSQLVPEFLLALGGAFLLGNLAAYVRLRPAWRDAKRARSTAGEPSRAPGPSGEAAVAPGASATGKPGAKATGPGAAAGKPGGAEATGAEATGTKPAGAGATGGNGKPGGAEPAALPSRARVLANMVAGLLVTVASLAALLNR